MEPRLRGGHDLGDRNAADSSKAYAVNKRRRTAAVYPPLFPALFGNTLSGSRTSAHLPPSHAAY